MNARETTFKVLIQGEKQFQVPLYQRTYSWQEKQLERLWEDIRRRAEGLSENGAGGTHFLGSVVLAPGVMQASMQHWIVVDGQQRITTLMLAMCAVRDHLCATDSTQWERFNELYLANRWQKGDDYLRLRPTKADLAAYQACIGSTADAGGADPIGAAYRFFRQRLAAADDPEDPFDISLIERTISDHLALVEITADRGDNVHRIFESLNNTGMRLSQADLVRNLLFMLIPHRGDQVYETTWLPMQKRLSTEQLEDLLYLYLVINGQVRVARDGIYQGMQAVLEPHRGDEAAVEAVVAELARRARHLRRIASPDDEPDARLRRAYHRLNAWGALVAYPVLMVLLDRHETGAIDTDELVTAVGYIESFLVRRMICVVPTNNLNRIFNALATQLPPGKQLAQEVREILSRERSYWPADQVLRDAIATRPFYFQGRGPQRQLVLRRLELACGSREPVDLEHANLTIEHVLPQTPTSDWLAVLAEEAQGDETPDDLHKQLVHTLGNLTLTAYNIELSNSPYERKQDLLQHSNLEMNKRIAATSRWGRAEILARASELAELAIKVWPGPVGTVHQPTGRNWSLLHQAVASLPAGAWTSYGDLASLIGSHPMPVGTHMSTVAMPNGHRVLRNDGEVSASFHWLDEADTRDVYDVLRQEGVRIEPGGVADPAQRLSARELAQLVALEADGLEEASGWDADPGAIDELHGRFLTQLETRSDAPVSDAVHRLLDDWRSLGGRLTFGRSAETSCVLMWREYGPTPWPGLIYPSGTLEVHFKPMSTRPPFDDVALRDEFRRRLNRAQGVDIPQVKLALYPSFRLDVLADPRGYSAVLDALRWFTAQLDA